jgi:hypothetical protein
LKEETDMFKEKERKARALRKAAKEAEKQKKR